jgi:exopolysaccharide biosynthesis protein
MRKTFKKFFIYLLIFSTLITWAPSSFAANVNMPYVIYETKDSEHLASGVLYENIKKFTSKGWWNINVIRVDLTNEYAEIKGLMSNKGISSRDSVSKLVTDNKAVAGVNGDFFDYSPVASPIGGFIQDGTIISSPVEKEYAWPSFLIDSSNKAEVMLLDRKISATSTGNSETVTINMINKLKPNFEGISLFNKYWGTKSPGNSHYNDLVEVVVEDNIVTDIRIGMEPVDITENKYIIAARGIYKDNLLKFFNIGDEVQLNITTTPNLENIKFAIGGGSIILKDGVPMATHYNAKGDHPRTGIGITQDGNELIIATIDGRGTSYKGVNQEIFGAILKDLGAYNAINLDGGGSTTMAVKPIDEQVAKVVNKPSDGGERRVVNGVGVFSNAPKGELSYIKINTDDKNMFPNTSRRFTIKGYDEHHNPVEVNQNNVIYSFEGIEGEINGNILKAKSPGKLTVTANYEGLTSTIDLKVFDEIKDISLSLDKFNINTNSQKNIGTIYGKDKNGFKAKIYPEDINWTVTNDIGYVENGVFYSGEKIGSGAITARIGEGVKSILISVGSNGVLVEDFENLENFKLTSYPNYVNGSMALDSFAKQGNNSIRIQYDFTQGSDTRATYLNFSPKGKNGLALEGKPNKLSLWVKGDGNGSWLRGTIKDKNGNNHILDFVKSLDSTDWQYVGANIPSNIAYPITLEQIYVVETDGSKKHSGEILLDGLTANYPISYDNIKVPLSSSLKDAKNVKSEKTKDGFSFIITKAPANLDKIAGYNASSKIQNKVNQHNISLFMGGTTEEFRKNIKNEKVINIGPNYTSHKYKNVLFIDANTTKGGLRPQNPQQWIWLKNNLNNATEDHIVLMLPTPVFGPGGFTDPLEAELLHNILVENFEKGKDIWVVHGGNSTKTDLKDGIRYIQFNNKDVVDANNIKEINAIEFIVNGNNMTYQISPIF